MSIELINHPYSTCSQKVRLCLHEKGIPFKNRWIDFRAREQLSPEYLKLNPNGVVPTLVVDGLPVVDSSVIMEYLEDMYPETPLQPADPYGKARMRTWLRFIEEVPTAAIRVPSFNAAFSRHYKDMTEEELEANAESRPLRTDFYRKMGAGGFDDATVQDSLDRLKMTLSRMDDALGTSHWLVGDQVTLADYCVVPTIDRMNDLGLGYLIDDYPNVLRWWDQIKARAAYGQTFVEGSRVTDVYDDIGPKLAKVPNAP